MNVTTIITKDFYVSMPMSTYDVLKRRLDNLHNENQALKIEIRVLKESDKRYE